MTQNAHTVRYLARRLLTLEMSQGTQSDGGVQATLSTLEKLRTRLTKRLGVMGFEVLLARSLVLAKAEAPWLNSIQVQAGATVTGLNEAAQQQTTAATTLGCMALLTQLLGLLVTFIGVPLTLGIVQDVWPEILLEDISSALEAPSK